MLAKRELAAKSRATTTWTTVGCFFTAQAQEEMTVTEIA
ncbi:hypothetical protein PPTG_22625 [Phytophthora nicotianae INRA-310]|uniref:Uncharacterized protein n=1 Tax=Phytophthora nicotianae (strain INRA-310) TaxID=761204 RepID=W2QCT6_PHYN3|nr:hypothetical protein PPTG_22625 [Phytophthora nicotianae INRA-310]ETN10998.1 hypothetical protein PPTG_22625 [Phytophthora nicotianae INRA-310]